MSENKIELDLFAEERKIKILELLRLNQKVSVNELAALFRVSRPTIRKYLCAMEQNGFLIRTHGGAIQKSQTGFELNTRQKSVVNLDEKCRIARVALNMIENGDTIMLDTGTTTMELAKLLHNKKNIKVVTNDIEIARILEDIESCETILIGGIIRKGFHCTVGLQGIDMCSQLSIDKAFIATNSFSCDKGATTPDLLQAEIKKAMLSIAGKVILLCDSSKIGKSSFVRFASVEQVHVLVTDNIDCNIMKKLEKNGLKVLVAE
ncbi:MAG: DeoR/GlpR family DNA-binding transcription regulator [Victivallaceae bacterium]